MAFQFGFATEDDIDVAADETAIDPPHISSTQDANVATDKTATVPVQEHSLHSMLGMLPERVAYSTMRVESPTGRVLYLPRRELFDIRVQLIAEGPENDHVVDHIEKSDLRSGVYEGGFKTWECSVDLASLLLDRGPKKDIDELIRCDNIIELGAGTALPTLVLFQHTLTNDIPMGFTLADYNDTVLRLVTLPNLILTWAAYAGDTGLQNLEEHGDGDLELTQELLRRFQDSLDAKRIHLRFLSGPWSQELADRIPPSAQDMGSLILAAETIYSPASTSSFVDLLVILLKRVKMAKAMLAAKRVYFGVGGSVDGLKEACAAKGAVAYEVENHGVLGMDAGIGRALIEVQMC